MLLWTSAVRSGSMRRRPYVRKIDEEARTDHSADFLAGPRADKIDAKEHDRPRRQLRADRPDRRRQAGLFDEVRQPSRAACAVAAGRIQGSAGAGRGSGAGNSAQRDFWLVL